MRSTLCLWVAQGLELVVVAPQHNAELALDAIRRQGGLRIDVAVGASRDEYTRGYANNSLRAHLNGTAIHGLWVPAQALTAGRTWLHVELMGVAATRPVAINVDCGKPLASVTAVLTLTLVDAARALVLLGTLRGDIEMLIVAPDRDIFALEALCGPRQRLLAESTLFENAIDARWPTYALQMALKLLVAPFIQTDFYLTLDADVVATRRFVDSMVLRDGRATLTPEPRSVHPHWWDGSADILGLGRDAFPDARFGVTPAVLSTPGVLAVLDLLRSALSARTAHWQAAWLEAWGPGMWWSEYTLYRLGLDERRLFDTLHGDIAPPLLCHAVWFDDQLPWDADAAFNESQPGCLFSLVQSSAKRASVATVARQVSHALRRTSWWTPRV